MSNSPFLAIPHPTPSMTFHLKVTSLVFHRGWEDLQLNQKTGAFTITLSLGSGGSHYRKIQNLLFPVVGPSVILDTLVKGNFSSVQLLSCVWLSATPWTIAHQASLSITNSQNFLKLMSLKSVMPSNHLILCCPLLLLPLIIPSIRVFSKESVLHIGWLKHWSFSFSISPSNEYSGLILSRLVLSPWSPRDSQESSPAPQLKASIPLCSAFFIVQLSHPYMTTGKTIALIRWTFVCRVMSRLFNRLSRLVIAFLPSRKHLLIS